MSEPPMITDADKRATTTTAGMTSTLGRDSSGRFSPVLVNSVTAAWMSGGVNMESTMNMITRIYSPLRKLLKKVL